MRGAIPPLSQHAFMARSSVQKKAQEQIYHTFIISTVDAALLNNIPRNNQPTFVVLAEFFAIK
jgi:hypothetical protein